MKRFICFLAIMFLIGGLTSNALAQKKPIKLKGVQFLQIRDEAATGFQTFVKSVNEKANGELVIEIVGGPETVPQRKQPEAVRSGAVDLSFVPATFYAPLVPPAVIMGLSRINSVEGRKTGFHDFLVEEHKKVGIRFIGCNDYSGQFHVFCKKPINSPSELKGLRFRHSTTYNWFEGLGLIGISASHADIYSGMERGLFVGTATKLGPFLDLSLNEVCKYIVGPGFWGNYSSVTIMNEAKYQSLPKHLQDLIQDAELETEQRLPNIMGPIVKGFYDEAYKKGMKHIAWSSEDTEWFLGKIDELTWKERVKKLPPGMGDKIKNMIGLGNVF